MKFGLRHDFRNPGPWFRPYAELYRLLLAQCVRADELGYDNLWLTEPHFSGDYNPAPLQAATALASRTERIRLGTFVLLLPFYHPVRVAEDVAFIDNLSHGRFDLGVGQRVSHRGVHRLQPGAPRTLGTSGRGRELVAPVVD